MGNSTNPVVDRQNSNFSLEGPWLTCLIYFNQYGSFQAIIISFLVHPWFNSISRQCVSTQNEMKNFFQGEWSFDYHKITHTFLDGIQVHLRTLLSIATLYKLMLQQWTLYKLMLQQWTLLRLSRVQHISIVLTATVQLPLQMRSSILMWTFVYQHRQPYLHLCSQQAMVFHLQNINTF